MNFVLIADTYAPLRNSGAVQLRDLSLEFVRQGHSMTVLLPSHSQADCAVIEQFGGVEVVRLKSLKTKDVAYARRTLAEALMPYFMWRSLRKSMLADRKWDGVIWYSPSIFHAPLVKRIKKMSACKSYLIIRDIFPDWAIDMGLLKKGAISGFFSAVARRQYAVADVIGVQTPGNLKYFSEVENASGAKVQVLQNWLGKPANMPCSIDVKKTSLAGRKIFVYAGNMGIAQGMGMIMDLVERLKDREDLGFLFVGRGSEIKSLQERKSRQGLDNVLFFDEIDPDEIPALYAQCDVGLVALDFRHQSHNIPGKFLTYMQSGLPVLANINPGNDLSGLIRQEAVGVVNELDSLDALCDRIPQVLALIEGGGTAERCKALFDRMFSAEMAVRQIVAAVA